ncbi:hypothetical protein [Elstera cyanobacteriorum]|uniref:hypothetical protein n=1 Tax=Elstera cyanobacteriorum TaxID=2022747 RepID=UPI001140188C|nr:hypothetical protein [Elstera cyanobacteriorum]
MDDIGTRPLITNPLVFAAMYPKTFFSMATTQITLTCLISLLIVLLFFRTSTNSLLKKTIITFPFLFLFIFNYAIPFQFHLEAVQLYTSSSNLRAGNYDGGGFAEGLAIGVPLALEVYLLIIVAAPICILSYLCGRSKKDFYLGAALPLTLISIPLFQLTDKIFSALSIIEKSVK